MNEIECPDCDARGYLVHYAHACNGNEKRCQIVCPVQEQKPCPVCNGTGFMEYEDE